MQKFADSVDAYLLSDYLLSDTAHISGLVAAGVIPSPGTHSDMATTTTHQSLRGPRGAMIFFRKGVRRREKKSNEELCALEDRIDASVSPGHPGPHQHTITAIGVA